MRTWTVAVLAAVLAVGAVGCGGSSSKKSGSASGSGSNANSGGAYGGSGGASAPSSSGPAMSSGSKLMLAADEEGKLYFNPSKLKAKAGSVTLVMNNPKTTGKMHGISIEGNGLDKDGKVVGPGATSKLTLTLKPGKYTFYCPVPGHRQGGMQGTLTVQ